MIAEISVDQPGHRHDPAHNRKPVVGFLSNQHAEKLELPMEFVPARRLVSQDVVDDRLKLSVKRLDKPILALIDGLPQLKAFDRKSLKKILEHSVYPRLVRKIRKHFPGHTMNEPQNYGTAVLTVTLSSIYDL
ncbi:hypothetical protein [Agrobacterium sp. SORGH_AS 787]|uniref:hypothetical protein n=1 Tax=Agrobacterium sp. SORGH_AS 787 TaxID=3041775 RepID=UPI0032B7E524